MNPPTHPRLQVSGSNENDMCKREFMYAQNRKGAANMVPVVMEKRCRGTNQWGGVVGMVLGHKMYVDMASDRGFDAKMDKLYNNIRTVLDRAAGKAAGEAGGGGGRDSGGGEAGGGGKGAKGGGGSRARAEARGGGGREAQGSDT